MGKPSSHHSKKSDHSLNLTPSQRIMSSLSTQKIEIVKRKRYKKTKSKLKTLVERFKRQSVSSTDTSQNETVININDTVDETESNHTVVRVESGETASQKRNIDLNPPASTKRKKRSSSCIIINDDNDTCPLNSPKRSKFPATCSTPIDGRDTKSLQNMIINNFPKSNNNSCSVNFNEEVINLTKEINKDSYITIDLTNESGINKPNNTVIDVETVLNNDTQTSDCTLVSISAASLSGESNVTVLQNKKANKNEMEVKKFTKGISKLNCSQRGKLLELITQNILNGCKIPIDVQNSVSNMLQSRATETVQDTYIKEVILGETKSRNSIGSNIYHPSKDKKNIKGLRMIVIDGSNVAMEHTKGKIFSVKGLKICIDYFVKKGHIVKAFVPRFRCKYGKSTDPRLLDHLERQALVVYTPSREIQGRMCTSYDDRYIVQCAAEFDGVIVSGDNYRDLLKENPRWRFVIENRVLPFTWVDDMIMFPRDPLGRNGPTLEQFLRHPVTSEAPIVL